MPTEADPYVAQRVQDAIAQRAAELGVEVSWRATRLVLRGHVPAQNCAEVLEAARAAASPVEVVDELEQITTHAVDDNRVERIEP